MNLSDKTFVHRVSAHTRYSLPQHPRNQKPHLLRSICENAFLSKKFFLFICLPCFYFFFLYLSLGVVK